jgi:hypothetical protein
VFICGSISFGLTGRTGSVQRCYEMSRAISRRQIIGVAIEVHRQLGPGLLGSAYNEWLCQELRDADLPFARQVPVQII